MLFQWDITHDTVDQIAATFFQDQEQEAPGIVDFALQLVTGTVEHVEEIDVLIKRHAADPETAIKGYYVVELIGDGVTVFLFSLATVGAFLRFPGDI